MMEAQPVALAPCYLMLLLAGLLVPGPLRSEWHQEWLGEVWYRYRALGYGNRWNWQSAFSLYRSCAGCFPDAWAQLDTGDERLLTAQRLLRSPYTCLLLLGGVLGCVCWSTGFCVTSRTILSPLPYTQAEQIALVSRTGRLEAVRRGIPRDLAETWRLHSKLLNSMAACSLLHSNLALPGGRLLHPTMLLASANLFRVLNSPLAPINNSGSQHEALALLSFAFWQQHFGGNTEVVGQRLTDNGRSLVIAGVLPPSFWFLSPSIDVFELDPKAVPEQATLLIRSSAGVSAVELESELAKVAQETGQEFARTAPHVLFLREAVQTPLWLFTGSLLMATVLVFLGFGSRLARRHSLEDLLFRTPVQWWLFLLVKSALGLAIVLTIGLEYFVGQTQSANQALGGPALLWFYVVGCSAVVFGSLSDQQSRCRVCLHTLAFPIRIGCPGCLFLDWSGTELLCPEGHGMLYIPHHVSCWEEQDRWIAMEA